MLKTPIASFLEKYAASDTARLHMPGHKGKGSLGESLDITEISGADSLYEADGIIKQSEENAAKIFGADTFYSTEGSSLSIRAMLYLTALYAREQNEKPLIAAARNAHKAFISAAALIDFDIDWLLPDGSSYLSSRLTASDVRAYFESARRLPTALYVTSPDYLGYISDIDGIARECKKRGVLLLVDNAHGAYLKFLSPSMHPIDLGADICCDSAHKTLSALTGCAYLHISKSAPALFKEKAKAAMLLFGSTSPSYLMLASLDRLNASLCSDYKKKLDCIIEKIAELKADLISHGYSLIESEPMKLTICAKEYGYEGYALSEMLLQSGIYSEFSDPDYLVLMPSAENSAEELSRLRSALLSIPKRDRIESAVPKLSLPSRRMSARDALFSPEEIIPAESSLGRIISTVNAACPPAVPIIVSGEEIDGGAISAFKYYKIEKINVVK